MAKRTVVGAGLSGMVAAIDLARQGDEVLVLEKEKAIGGSPAYHPSLHATPIDLRYTSDFIGIDISRCFQLLSETQLWIRNKRLYPSLNHYGVERGDRETAIDSYLYKMCLDHGVQFEFGHPVKRLKDVMYLYYMFETIARLPQSVKLQMLASMPAYYKYTKVLFGRMGHGIPGYPRDWMEEFTRD